MGSFANCLQSMTAYRKVTLLDKSTHGGSRHFYQIAQTRMPNLKGPGLVVGYGRGHEATFLKQHLQIRIVGVDLHPPVPDYDFTPILANALYLPFFEATFEFVFFHHVIEHIPDPSGSLMEIQRVLRPGGWLYIATPNRYRIIGYIGSYGATIRQKILWNLTDYADRLRGRFTNEMGAHAGFSRQELEELLREQFSEIQWLTRDYLWFKYSARIPKTVLKLLTLDSVMNFVAPSFYALCRK